MGDAEAYAVFVRHHAGTLFRTAFMLTGDAADAEELLQDTLALLYPRWDKVTAADSPVAYVRRSLVNRLVSLRRHPSSRDVLLSALPDQPSQLDPANGVVDRDQLWQLLATLSARQRAALVLRYLYDMPDEEIAEALGCRVSTVRSLISRAVASLRDGAIATGGASRASVAAPKNGVLDDD